MSCGKDGLVSHALSGVGKVVSYTTIHAPPTGYEGETPYVVGVVELKEGPLVTAQIDVDVGSVRVGVPVRVVFRRLHDNDESGILFYGFKFVPQ